MDGSANKGDAKTKNDCVANLKLLFPAIKPGDMTTIVNAIFNLLKVTDKVEAQHTKKRPPKKMNEKRKEKNDAFKARKKQEAADRKKELPTPQKAAQQKQATPEESSENEAAVMPPKQTRAQTLYEAARRG